MPYYRILIWLKQKQKTIQGIRFLELWNIDVVLNQMRVKANEIYGESYVDDVEVQMLSKNCSAVKDHLAESLKRRDMKKNPGWYINKRVVHESRKEAYARQSAKKFEEKQEELRRNKEAGNSSEKNYE
jgi:hypothetical protein